MRHLRALLFMLLFGLVACALAADPVRIAIECEDMQGVKAEATGFTQDWTFGKWGRDLLQNMIFGGVWASRMAAAVTDDGNNTAAIYQDIDVPRDDHYKLWAKYECPPNFNYPFAIRVEHLDAAGQPAGKVYEKTYGLRESPKHFCFTTDLTTGDLYWAWGMDHDAAEGYTLDLTAGKYRVTLTKVPGPAPVGPRSVDVLLLTTKLDKLSAPDYPRYPLLDELQQINHVYFRFTNTGNMPIVMDYNHWGHRYEYFYQIGYPERVRCYDANGQMLLDEKGKPLALPGAQWNKPILPGQSSPWIDLGPTMTVESDTPFIANAKATDEKGTAAANQPAFVPFTMDIALTPGEKGIVKSFSKAADEPEMVVNVQPDLQRPEGREYTETGRQVYERMTKEMNALPRVGPMPKKLRLFASVGSPYIGGKSTDPAALKAFADYSIAMGLNTLGPAAGNTELADAMTAYYAKAGAPLVQFSGDYQHTQDLELLKKTYADPRAKARLYFDSFGDEIGLPAVDPNDKAKLADFQAYAQKQGFKPQDLGYKTWVDVKPLASYTAQAAVGVGLLPTTSAKPALPAGAASLPIRRLFWLTHEFVIISGIADYAKKTQAMTAYFGPQFKTSANLGGMHPFYWMNQASFIEAFRGNALTLGWSEDYDYTQPEASRLCIEYQSAFLRAGSKYHDTPMQFYNMPHFPGNTGRHLIQNAVSLWGQGVKDLDFFSASPDLFSTENYIHSRGGIETAGAIRRLSGMAGNVEDALLPARTRPGKVAILLSEASDVWEVGGGGQWDVAPGTIATNAYNEERKATWYALRHAGYLVDLLTENDVADGRLKDYKVLYVNGRNMERRTAAALLKWVKAGGTISLTANAARFDEFDAPLTALDGLVGRGSVVKADYYKGPLRAKLELIQLQPKDRVTLNLGQQKGAFDAYASVETFAAAKGAKVNGAFSGGQPALVGMKSGKGWGFYAGTLPGQSYLHKALPLRVMGKGGLDDNFCHFEPTNFDENAAAAILLPVRQAGVKPDIEVNRRGVVASILDGPTATVVTILKLGEDTIMDDVQQSEPMLIVHGVRPAKRIHTAMNTPGMAYQNTRDGIAITLPALNDADVIVIEH